MMIFVVLFGVLIPKNIGQYEVIGIVNDEELRLAWNTIFGTYSNNGIIDYKRILLFLLSAFLGYFFYNNIRSNPIYIKRYILFAVVLQILMILLFYIGFDFYNYTVRERASDLYGPRFYLGFAEPSYMSVILAPMLSYMVLFSKRKSTVIMYITIAIFFLIISRSGGFLVLFLSIISIYILSNYFILSFLCLLVILIFSFGNSMISYIGAFELFNSIFERTLFYKIVDFNVLLFGSGIVNVYSPLPIVNFIYGFGVVGSLILLFFFKPSFKLVLSVLLIYSLVPRFEAFEPMIGLAFIILIDNRYLKNKEKILEK